MNAGELYPIFASMLTLRPWARLQKRSFENLRTAGATEVGARLHLTVHEPLPYDVHVVFLTTRFYTKH